MSYCKTAINELIVNIISKHCSPEKMLCFIKLPSLKHPLSIRHPAHNLKDRRFSGGDFFFLVVRIYRDKWCHLLSFEDVLFVLTWIVLHVNSEFSDVAFKEGRIHNISIYDILVYFDGRIIGIPYLRNTTRYVGSSISFPLIYNFRLNLSVFSHE